MNDSGLNICGSKKHKLSRTGRWGRVLQKWYVRDGWERRHSVHLDCGIDLHIHYPSTDRSKDQVMVTLEP